MKKVYFIMFFLLGFAGFARSQNSQPAQTAENPWTLLKAENGVKIYYTRGLACMNVNSLALKIENSSAADVQVSWILPESVKKIPMNNGVKTSLTLTAGTTEEAKCSSLFPVQLTVTTADNTWIPDSNIFSISVIKK